MDIKTILEKHNKWLREEEGGERADLRYKDLRYAKLRDADLRDADLSDANLRDADLRDADLSDANLRDADLRDADLRDADLSDADLKCANLRDADLSDADLSDADLSETIGIKYADCSFSGFGERNRRLLCVRINDEDVYFCGCFKGSLSDIEKYIEEGKKEYKKSRLTALNFIKERMAE